MTPDGRDPKFDKGVFVIFTPFFALVAIPFARWGAIFLTNLWKAL